MSDIIQPIVRAKTVRVKDCTHCGTQCIHDAMLHDGDNSYCARCEPANLSEPRTDNVPGRVAVFLRDPALTSSTEVAVSFRTPTKEMYLKLGDGVLQFGGKW